MHAEDCAALRSGIVSKTSLCSTTSPMLQPAPTACRQPPESPRCSEACSGFVGFLNRNTCAVAGSLIETSRLRLHECRSMSPRAVHRGLDKRAASERDRAAWRAQCRPGPHVPPLLQDLRETCAIVTDRAELDERQVQSAPLSARTGRSCEQPSSDRRALPTRPLSAAERVVRCCTVAAAMRYGTTSAASSSLPTPSTATTTAPPVAASAAVRKRKATLVEGAEALRGTREPAQEQAGPGPLAASLPGVVPIRRSRHGVCSGGQVYQESRRIQRRRCGLVASAASAAR